MNGFPHKWSEDMHYTTEEELEIHKQIHSGDRPFKCQYPECTFAAKSKDKLQIHHSRHSLEKIYRCLWPTCDKSFTIGEQLRRHRKLHTNREHLICEFTGCDVVFQTAQELEKHLRRHIGLDDSVVESLNPMPYKCGFGLCSEYWLPFPSIQSFLIFLTKNHIFIDFLDTFPLKKQKCISKPTKSFNGTVRATEGTGITNAIITTSVPILPKHWTN